ncbi:magnesium transporter CorA family protein [Candidatus Gracilibacteria bacterium]|nr:magnesium transporter CorA family protein [Candidatus Gracilibacteria bacterium]
MKKTSFFKHQKLKNIEWIDGVYSNKNDTKQFLEKFKFHELDIEACLEDHQNPRIDYYDDYIFITLHFPKYNKNTKRFYFNEMNFFLMDDKIISLRRHNEKIVDKIFEEYKHKKNFGEDFKITSAYILYEILQVMIEKNFKILEKITFDVRTFEENVFKSPDISLVKEIMVKKRNVVFLKHMIKPEINVVKMIELKLKKIFDDDLEVYFEDLEDKIQKVFSDTERILEFIDATEDTLKTLVSIKTSHSMWMLTLLSTFLLPLTLVTSFYGMNVDLPFENNPFIVYFLIFLSGIMTFGFIYKIRKSV